jgi:hypothetical protein
MARTMSETLDRIHGVTTLICLPEGRRLHTDRDAVELISVAIEQRADLIVIPVERFPDDFFRLETGIAGEVLQKFVIYQLRLAVVGDLSAQTAASSALRAFVAESNRGDWIWFVPDQEMLHARVAAFAGRGGR